MTRQLEQRVTPILFRIFLKEKHIERLLQKMMKLGVFLLQAEGACFFMPVKWTREWVLHSRFTGSQPDFPITGREVANLFADRHDHWKILNDHLFVPFYANETLEAVICFTKTASLLQADTTRVLTRMVKLANELFEEKKLQREKEYYHSALVQIANVIKHSEIFDDVVAEAIEMASEVVGATCGILLLSKDQQSLHPIYTRNVKSEDMFSVSFAPTKGNDQTAHLAVTERKTVTVEDALSDPRVDWAFCKKYGIRSYMTLPLFIHDRDIGVLYINFKYKRKFDEQIINFFKELGQQISYVIYSLQVRNELLQTKYLQDRLIEMMREMTSRIRLRDVVRDMVSKTYQLLEEKVGVSVWLINESKDQIRLALWQGEEIRLDRKRGAEFSLEELGNAAVLQDLFLELDPASKIGQFFKKAGLNRSIGTPLMAGKELTGILFLHGLDDHAWTEQEKLTLSTIGTHAGPIIRHGQYIQTLEKESKLDGLTKVYNRQYFEKVYRDYSNRHIRLNKPFTLLMIDLDNFKQINDIYGHLVGDDVMRSVAKTLLDTIRRTDKAFRYGGEEFAIFLPWTGKHEAMQVAERIRVGIEQSHRNPMVTVSIGLATFLESTKDPMGILELADLALYRAKSSGKNRVVTAG